VFTRGLCLSGWRNGKVVTILVYEFGGATVGATVGIAAGQASPRRRVACSVRAAASAGFLGAYYLPTYLPST
jgi:hypothetical protein